MAPEQLAKIPFHVRLPQSETAAGVSPGAAALPEAAGQAGTP
jgi:hypothetical protein